jgi:hypothetical protein
MASKSKAAAFLVAAAFIASAVFSCTSKPSPETSFIRTTKAFDALFGDLPPTTVPGPCYATVVYFPSARESGKFLPAPLFSAEQGKEEMLTVRTVIRGIEAEEFSREAVLPFPPGSDLDSLSYEGGVARIRVGGKFKAADFTPGQGERAAKALALTVTQFGKATSVEVTDAEGRARFSGRADQARTVDVGPPKVLGLLAIREDKDSPPSVLSVLFNRPVFVDEIAFFPPEGNTPIPGKAYSTGFGMTVELHPDPKFMFEPGRAYRVRLAVRDGKGKRMRGEKEWISKEATRD